MRTFRSPEDITAAVGDELGVSDWVTVTQERVNQFAEATGDHQWIDVDPERATRESPFGGPIAHGYLSLSLLPMLGWQIYTVANAKLGINYGSNKVRFPAPVPVGSRVRLSSSSPASRGLVECWLSVPVRTCGFHTPWPSWQPGNPQAGSLEDDPHLAIDCSMAGKSPNMVRSTISMRKPSASTKYAKRAVPVLGRASRVKPACSKPVVAVSMSSTQ